MPAHIPVSGSVERAWSPAADSQSGGGPSADAALVTALRATIRATLSPLIPPGTRCAILGFPAHGNVGDSAIWAGQLALLRTLGATVAYTGDARTFSRQELVRRLGSGIVLLAGGGNLGDLWPGEQKFRETVIDTIRDRRIIQLPQSIHFGSPRNLAYARDILDRHPDLLLLVRDRRSLEIARNEFRAPSLLCPDLALALGPLPRPAVSSVPSVWLMRRDAEAARSEVLAPPAIDWVGEPRSTLATLGEALANLVGRRPWLRPLVWRPLAAARSVLARRRLAHGCAILSRGRLVVTDRLHGHILSMMLGIPHVVVSDRYGKIRNFYETWTRTSQTAIWAESAEHARAFTSRY